MAKRLNPTTNPPLRANKSATNEHEDILLIHLSDLHLGATHRFPISNSRERAHLGIRFGRAIKAAATDLGVAVDRALVAVTGDLTNSGQADEFEWAIEVLQGLGGELGIVNQRFVFCPGNHDIDWLECQIAELQAKQKKLGAKESRNEIDSRKLDRYRDFLKNFYGDNLDHIARPIAREARRQDFEDLRVSVISLNACERESHKKDDHVGHVSDDQAQAICDSWLSDSKRDWIRILTVHQNPDSTAPDNLEEIRKSLGARDKLDSDSYDRIIADIAGFEGRNAVRRAAESARVSMLMHGHQHEGNVRSWKWPSGGETLVMAAGSTGADQAHLPGEQPNQIRLLVLRPGDATIRVRTLVWDPRARPDGSVSIGDFTPGVGERDTFDGSVYIPPAFPRTSASINALTHPATDRQLQEFLDTYRQRLKHTWADWDLKGMAAVGGMGKPVAAGLDDMYQPLRLGPPGENNHGSLLLAQELIKFKSPPNAKTRKKAKLAQRRQQESQALLVRGPAGAGKTTWMRFTFRRLLENPAAVPFMLVLRDVAERWSRPDRTGQERSLDACIRDSVAERMGEGWNKDLFLRVLTATDGPVPVLMVDGWDEIGDHGQKLREMLLGFMQQHPRVRIVVSTRPWGDGVPDGAHGFMVLEVKPLLDTEIKSFATRFFRVCYRLEDAAVSVEVGRFLERLHGSTEAASLAKTALFLTMMLVVSRHKPLPDKRHQLYRECLTTLLTDRPDTWAREGVQRNHEWWRPEDAEQRWKAVARLAAELQAKGYGGAEGPRKAVIATENDIVAGLPVGWKAEQRKGFLWWLIGEAGLITDRADGSYTFAHLSFQEYLTAWHLHASVSDGGWANPVLQRMGSESWWETLLLYAAEVGSTSDERADSILSALVAHGSEALPLAGMILADGGGKDATTEQWAKAWAADMEWDRPTHRRGRCAAAWASSQQSDRRSVLSAAIGSAAASARYWHWQRLLAFATQAKVQLPSSRSTNRIVGWASAESMSLDPVPVEAIALSRVIHLRDRIDRPFDVLVDLLRLWPSRRCRLGTGLQSAVIAGAPVDALAKLAKIILQDYNEEELESPQPPSKEVYSFRKLFHNNGVRDSLPVSGDPIRYSLYESMLFEIPKSYQHDDFFLYSHHLFEQKLASRLISSLQDSYFGRAQEVFADLLTLRSGVRSSSFDGWTYDYIRGDIFAALERMRVIASAFGRSSRRPYTGELLHIGPALERHIAGQSSEKDRSYLIELASHPQRASFPLSVGLQYFVRGDILLESGETLTLDELLSANGLPALPLLDDPEVLKMPGSVAAKHRGKAGPRI